MKVIVGLGNPGREYAATRHNVGWWLIDHLADVWHFDGWKNFVRRPFWSPAKDLLIVVDEVQLPVGRIRIRPRGSAGGHNGLKSVEHALGTQEYGRLRIGVGPSEERKGIYKDLADFVLSPFARDERGDILALMPQLTATVETWLHEGVEKAMNLYNRAPESDPDSDSA